MASQRLTDFDDAGGRMSGIEIVDGNVNNLFPDISRLDRVYGRVSLRKSFVSVQTADTDTYSGSHVILSVPAADPRVSVCMFTTGDPHDERTAAQDYVESYVTRGPKYQGWLWGDQLQGSRAILIFQKKGLKIPKIGSVFFLIKDEGLSTEKSQYVRVSSVESSTEDFTTSSSSTEYGEIATSFDRTVVTMTISDPLRETYPGIAITSNDAVIGGSIYTTAVADAAQYYGVMQPTAALNDGDISISVDSIFAHLVPSAQGEAPMVDLSVGEAGPVIGSGVSKIISVLAFPLANGANLFFGQGLKPGSLVIVGGGHTYTDNGGGLVMEGTTQRGTVDYSTGQIIFSGVQAGSTNFTVTAIAGSEVPRISDTFITTVELSNRGYNYTVMLTPLPTPGTLTVDYMAQGEWYRLRENGQGVLVPDIAATGTGTVNLLTGSVILTCAALPDVGSAILYAWGSPLETEDLSGQVVINAAEIKHTVAEAPIKPGSLLLSWPSGGATVTATDNGAGALTGAATGSVDYARGEIAFKPTLLPLSSSVYEIDYEKYPFVTETVTLTTGSGVAIGNLAQGAKSGTVKISVLVNFAGFGHVYEMLDNGAGVLSAPGFSGILDGSGSGGDSNFGYRSTLSESETSTSIEVSGLTGAIDYVTRSVSLNVGAITGAKVTTTGTYSADSIVLATRRTKTIENYSTATTNITGGACATLTAKYTLSAAAASVASETTPALPVVLDLTRDIAGRNIVPGSVSFTLDGVRYIDRLGRLYRNPDPLTGLGADVGSIDYITGIAQISNYSGGAGVIVISSMSGRFGNQFLSRAFFRTPGAPLRPGSFQIQGVVGDGRAIAGSSDFSGAITGSLVMGSIDYETGIVSLAFGELVDAIGNETESWYDIAGIDGNGKIFKPVPAFCDTLSYTCVVYSFIPLDATLLGLDPVRLPVDGRVPICRSGDVVVIHNTKTDTLPNGLTSGQIITLSRPDVVHCECYDANGLYVPTTKYTWNKDIQKLTFAAVLDLTGFVQPLVAMHRIEDMCLVSDVQINGTVTVATGISHDYPLDGETYVSSALLFGDLQARQYNLFDQVTWTSVWSDDQIGDAATGSYNEVNYPIVVTNSGGTKGRWALVFTDPTHFNIMEEKLGVVGSGYIIQDAAPLNPATNQPYFFIDYRGWGAGWSPGNVVRFNTDGANKPLWIARTTLQGPVTEPNDQFTIQIRGDAE